MKPSEVLRRLMEIRDSINRGASAGAAAIYLTSLIRDIELDERKPKS